MFSIRRLLSNQKIIIKNNLERINPLNECETIYTSRNSLKNRNPLNECERPIENPEHYKKFEKKYNIKWNKSVK